MGLDDGAARHAEPPFSTDLRAVLALLVAGATEAGIAQQLHRSLRAVQMLVAQCRHILTAPTLYSLGAMAVRAEYLNSDEVIRQAQQRRRSSSWTTPSTRQAQVLRELAAGGTYGDVAAATGFAARTVRRDLAVLAESNSVRGLAAAGALFEALRWHAGCPPPVGRIASAALGCRPDGLGAGRSSTDGRRDRPRLTGTAPPDKPFRAGSGATGDGRGSFDTPRIA